MLGNNKEPRSLRTVLGNHGTADMTCKGTPPSASATWGAPYVMGVVMIKDGCNPESRATQLVVHTTFFLGQEAVHTIEAWVEWNAEQFDTGSTWNENASSSPCGWNLAFRW